MLKMFISSLRILGLYRRKICSLILQKRITRRVIRKMYEMNQHSSEFYPYLIHYGLKCPIHSVKLEPIQTSGLVAMRFIHLSMCSCMQVMILYILLH